MDTLLPKNYESVQKLAKEGIRNSDTSGYAVTSKNMKLCEKWLGKVSEILIHLDSLLRQEREIVRKLAGKGIGNSETSGHAVT